MPSTFSIPYATYANYSPKGPTEISQRSRTACYGVKAGDSRYIQALIQDLVANFANYPFEGFLGPDVTLVPTPRSSPLVTGGLWPAKIIADALRAAGLGRDVLPLVERITAVPKSATAGPGNRPDVQKHYDSFGVTPVLLSPVKFTLVDDVLTKGRTTIAAAKRLQEAYPDGQIRIFAVMRTQGLISDVASIKDPSIGVVSLCYGDAQRDP